MSEQEEFNQQLIDHWHSRGYKVKERHALDRWMLGLLFCFTHLWVFPASVYFFITGHPWNGALHAAGFLWAMFSIWPNALWICFPSLRK